MTAKHFEAKLYAMRRNKDGLVISFVVHPSDITSDILTPDIGTRYMVAVAEIGDDEQPETFVPQSTPFIEAVKKEIAAKPHKPFASLPLSQQAAIRCADTEFRKYVAKLDGAGQFLMYDIDMTADYVRAECCITSRKELDDESNRDARIAWASLERAYQTHLTTQKYGQAAR